MVKAVGMGRRRMNPPPVKSGGESVFAAQVQLLSLLLQMRRHASFNTETLYNHYLHFLSFSVLNCFR